MHDLQQSMRLNFIENDLHNKRTNMHNMTMDKQLSVNNRLTSLQSRRTQVRDNYRNTQLTHFDNADSAVEHVQHLANVENELVERLKNTTTQQQRAYNTLDSLVKESYDYYQDTYDKKQKTYEQMFPPVPKQGKALPKITNTSNSSATYHRYAQQLRGKKASRAAMTDESPHMANAQRLVSKTEDLEGQLASQ